MTKTRNCLSALCLIAVSTAACAAPSAPNDAPPPYAGDVKIEKPAPQSGPAARKPSAEEANPLLPSKSDMEKAREEARPRPSAAQVRPPDQDRGGP